MFPRVRIKQNQKSIVSQRRGETLLVTLIYFSIIHVLTLSRNINIMVSHDRLSFLVFGLSLYSWIVSICVLPALDQGYRFYTRKLSDNTPADLFDLFVGFRDYRRVIYLALWQILFVFLWSLFFFIPGIIAVYRYRFAYFILMDNPELRAKDALKFSSDLTRGFKWELFKLDLSFLGWNILCVLTLGILRFWIAPYQNAVEAEVYQFICTEKYSM